MYNLLEIPSGRLLNCKLPVLLLSTLAQAQALEIS